MESLPASQGPADPEPGPQPSNGIHPETAQAIDRHTAQFSSNLMAKAESNKLARGSAMLADSDVEDAYWQITGKTEATKMARFSGDICIGAGGILVGAVPSPTTGHPIEPFP